jgi:hypothetical protein
LKYRKEGKKGRKEGREEEHRLPDESPFVDFPENQKLKAWEVHQGSYFLTCVFSLYVFL